LQILADGGGSAADAHILTSSDRPRLIQRRLDPLGDEMEDGAAFHLQRRARMVRQDKDRHMVRWIGAPPALPLIVRPGSAHRSEHVAAHDPGAEILERVCREVVVDAGRPAVSTQNVPLEDAGWNEPLVQLFAATAERLVTALVGAGAEAIGRHGKSVHAKLGHGHLLDCRCMVVRPAPRAEARRATAYSVIAPGLAESAGMFLGSAVSSARLS